MKFPPYEIREYDLLIKRVNIVKEKNFFFKFYAYY